MSGIALSLVILICLAFIVIDICKFNNGFLAGFSFATISTIVIFYNNAMVSVDGYILWFVLSFIAGFVLLQKHGKDINEDETTE